MARVLSRVWGKSYNLGIVRMGLIGLFIVGLSWMGIEGAQHLQDADLAFGFWIILLFPLFSSIRAISRFPRRVTSNQMLKALLVVLFVFVAHYAMIYPIQYGFILLNALDPMDTTAYYQYEFMPKFIWLALGMGALLNAWVFILGRHLHKICRNLASTFYNDNLVLFAIDSRRGWKQAGRELWTLLRMNAKRRSKLWIGMIVVLVASYVIFIVGIPWLMELEGYDPEVFKGITIS